MKRNLLAMLSVLAIFAGAIVSAAQAQKSRAASNGTALVQRPLYTDYKGVRLGMMPQDVRGILGDPVLKDAEMDYYVLPDNVTAQVVYDAAHKVKAISVDYAGGIGAPDYRAVLGEELNNRPDGSAFKMIRYEAQGFWVSYNRTAGPAPIVTVTLQKI